MKRKTVSQVKREIQAEMKAKGLKLPHGYAIAKRKPKKTKKKK